MIATLLWRFHQHCPTVKSMLISMETYSVFMVECKRTCCKKQIHGLQHGMILWNYKYR